MSRYHNNLQCQWEQRLALRAELLFPPEKCSKNDSKHIYVFLD